jgi:hypothetical protein
MVTREKFFYRQSFKRCFSDKLAVAFGKSIWAAAYKGYIITRTPPLENANNCKLVE